ncbi:hypothetical protein [Jannaschia seohaensis]|uniref:Glycosyl transferase family 2 n=1 Tax=Jannaschia seohaensis TaxID=475081 RepID=A0A2Y9C8Y5_9RHOB|nr:hypothetical protein [Jannaschia seohaensis]PWJ12905.1 hypothetical protein BCF38_11541 [Jannaschia seohaensis]SSA50713.1 hypothetical protein SAMN05421539_11541 [Jannaschia seohaensis]
MSAVDIALTSISSRLAGLPRTLETLLAQDHAPGAVHLYLSHEPHLLDQGVPETPAPIAALQVEDPRLQVHFVPNWGPYRKLLPYLRTHWGQSRLVATADDDTLYPKDWLGGLVAAHGVYGCAVAYRGHQIRLKGGAPAPYRHWMRGRLEQNPGRLILPTGKDGVLYDTAFFPAAVLDIETALTVAPTVDDLWFRWHLGLAGVPCYILNPDYTAGTLEADEAGDSLYRVYNQAGGNDAAVARLDAHMDARHGFRLADLDPEAPPRPPRPADPPPETEADTAFAPEDSDLPHHLTGDMDPPPAP